MIVLKNKDANNYFLEFKDELNNKRLLLQSLAPYHLGVKRIDTDNWIVPKELGPILEEYFKVEYFIAPWRDIGSTLKYSPYEYQKEIVHFAYNNGSSLIISPTGSGKK
jgi:ATP-dependent helicase YprA (DUF1998 family)